MASRTAATTAVGLINSGRTVFTFRRDHDRAKAHPELVDVGVHTNHGRRISLLYDPVVGRHNIIIFLSALHMDDLNSKPLLFDQGEIQRFIAHIWSNGRIGDGFAIH